MVQYVDFTYYFIQLKWWRVREHCFRKLISISSIVNGINKDWKADFPTSIFDRNTISNIGVGWQSNWSELKNISFQFDILHSARMYWINTYSKFNNIRRIFIHAIVWPSLTRLCLRRVFEHWEMHGTAVTVECSNIPWQIACGARVYPAAAKMVMIFCKFAIFLRHILGINWSW